MDGGTNHNGKRRGEVARISIGTQTDLRLAIRCVCERHKSDSKGAAKGSRVGTSPTESELVKINASAAATTKKDATSLLTKKGFGPDQADAPSEDTGSETKHRVRRRGKKILSQKGRSKATLSIDTSRHGHQEQQLLRKQIDDISAQISRGVTLGTGGTVGSKGDESHRDKAEYNNSIGNKSAQISGRRNVGQTAAIASDSAVVSAKPVKSLQERSFELTSGSHVTGDRGVSKCSYDLSANRSSLTNKQQSKSQSHQTLTACYRSGPASTSQFEQSNNPSNTNSEPASSDLKPGSSTTFNQRNKGALAKDELPKTVKPQSPPNSSKENQQGGTSAEGGRTIIYLTNRDQLELRAKLMVDAVPFRMPGS